MQQAETMLRGLNVLQYNKMVPLYQTKKDIPIFSFIATGRSVLNIYHDLVERNSASTFSLTIVQVRITWGSSLLLSELGGGHNNNPNVRQIRAGYEHLLVQHSVKTSTGNCLLRDNTEVLDSIPATVSVARRAEVELVEVDISEAAIPVLSEADSLSEYKEPVINYIMGFIVKKMKDKITCLPYTNTLISDGAAHLLFY